MDFEVLDISGDVGIRAFGKSCGEAFVNAGLGMYGLITDIASVSEREAMDIEAKGDSLEGLLVNYLNELVFYFDAHGFIGRRIEVTELVADCAEPGSIRVKVFGEEFNPARHERHLLIKAATYHNIKAGRTDGKWEVDVIFDI